MPGWCEKRGTAEEGRGHSWLRGRERIGFIAVIQFLCKKLYREVRQKKDKKTDKKLERKIKITCNSNTTHPEIITELLSAFHFFAYINTRVYFNKNGVVYKVS